eukprot:CAMPEP_0177591260 /NCGR_PEP_ID=MMETSP0419_2-20121207/7897_1 /TAXON_ID=582737 /ORGANISM="Tetraselmis sp., Strain GSL018" /LENGTH=724 /DNA_ID=CAMNT_0019081979 /DNA_START=126 /DNA_END=2300 /DNA_ORIENTATION=+
MLGRGSQGSVILVKRKSDNLKYCIKRIFIDDTVSSYRAEVLNEIQILSKLGHPNITKYYGSFIEDGVLNVVMEYADNGSLFQHIQRARHPLSEAQIVKFFVQLLLALQHLHSKNILHRDIKTKNIFVTKRMQVKLGDFGLAKMLGSASSFAQSAVGTPYYLSPELCNGKPYNHKSDVWSLGCVVYEMATFRHPFNGTNLPALIMAIIEGQYRPLTQQYSLQLQEAIEACLRKHPEQRPSVEDLLRFPVVQRELLRVDAETALAAAEATEAEALCSHPFFSSGRLLTPLRSAQPVSCTAVLAEAEEDRELEWLVARLRTWVEVRDRVRRRVAYFKCFTGRELVSVLVSKVALESRQEATDLAQKWMDGGVLYHVDRSEDFSDSDELFRFKDDEVSVCLNAKRISDGSVRLSKDIENTFTNLLIELYDSFLTSRGSLVDYESLAESNIFREFCSFTCELQSVDLSSLSFNDKVAFFINSFNALVLHGFVVLGPPTRLHQRLHFYNHVSYLCGGQEYSLNIIEHGILRGNQKIPNSYCRTLSDGDSRLENAFVVWDPRLHFALNRGTKSCPPIKVYRGDTLDDQLTEAATDFCCRNIKLVRAKHEEKESMFVEVPALFEWYRADFGDTDAQLLRWISQYLDTTEKQVLLEVIERDAFRVKYREFDWSLNKAPSLQPAEPSRCPPKVHPPPSSVADTTPTESGTLRVGRPSRHLSARPKQQSEFVRQE